ncbi:MAG: FkbM family methyltransferase [Chloroflexota bacterium]
MTTAVRCLVGATSTLRKLFDDLYRISPQRVQFFMRGCALRRVPGPYSQDGLIERVIAKCYTECRHAGFFVDVGAYDGVSLSNSRALFLMGWSGICIEPGVAAFGLLKNVYRFQRRVKCVQLAAGSRDAAVELFEAGVLSTLNDEARDLPWAQGTQFNTVPVPMKTLDALLEGAHAPTGFDVLSIDVEGSEADVLAGFNITKWKPRIVIIELVECDTHGLRAIHSAVESYFSLSGYTRGEHTAINTVYYRDRRDVDPAVCR